MSRQKSQKNERLNNTELQTISAGIMLHVHHTTRLIS